MGRRIDKINYKNIQNLASELMLFGNRTTDLDKKETYYRSAMSRAYYSVFIHARDKMEIIKRKSNPKYNTPKDGGIHEIVRKFWEKRLGLSKKKSHLKRHLNTLRIQRNKADYNFTFVFNKKTTVKNVKISILLSKQLELEK